VSIENISALIERARVTAADARKNGDTSPADRERLKDIAEQFESMLLVQMLKDMRKAGAWDEAEENDTFGAESLFETLDVELASHLARARGMGLKEELLAAFDRTQPVPPTTESAGEMNTVEASGLRAQAPGRSQGTGRRPEASDSPEARALSPEASLRPVSGAVTSEFGWRRDPFTSQMKFHQGVDLKAAYGQEVQAAGAGTVVFSGEQGGYGTSIVIEHGDGTKTRYAHLSATLVHKGDAVDAGQAVGRAGRSGRATGPHLHFEVIARNGARVPPRQWAAMGLQRTETSGD
jgi:murein DD-endopeptidase MepM/ murein hydrolase activator NlpD